MYHRILVAVANAERDEIAVTIAKRIAERADATLVLLHIRSMHDTSGSHAHLSEALWRYIHAIKSSGLRVVVQEHIGPVPQKIAETTHALHCDLVVLTPQHDLSPALASWRPHVLNYQLTHTLVPQLIWPDQTPQADIAHFLTSGMGPIMVPLDGTDQAERAIPFAVWFVRAFSSSLRLVGVAQPLLESGRAEREVRSYLERVAGQVAARYAIVPQTAVFVGRPAEELIWAAEAQQASLIVMSMHDRRRIARAVNGSVSGEILRHATTPLLIIPPQVTPESNAPESNARMEVPSSAAEEQNSPQPS